MAHETRSDGAARHGRRREDLTFLELELDGVPSHGEVAHGCHAIATRRQMAQLFEHRLVALGGDRAGGALRSGGRRVQTLCVGDRAAYDEQGAYRNGRATSHAEPPPNGYWR